VTEQVGVDVADSGLLAPALDDRANAWGAKWTAKPEP
jgi:hypothetical protein